MSFNKYDQLRINNVMRNNSRLQALGIKTLSGILETISLDQCNETRAKNKASNGEDSGSEYDPQEDEGGELEEALKEKRSISTRSRVKASKTSKMAPGGRLRKRVTASSLTDQVLRVTRSASKQLPSAHSDEDRSQDRDEVCTPCHARICPTLEGSSQPRSDIGVTPSIMCDVEQVSDVVGQVEEHTQLDDDDTPSTPKRWCRGLTMGKGLDRMTKSMGTKMRINVVEGKRRPEQPVQAAKLASECGVALRQHVPILPHWKDYKKDENQKGIEEYMGQVAGKFDMNINDKTINHACTDMLKSGVRQLRYRLKKRYFDGVPANQVRTTSPIATITNVQWVKLVEKWSDPKNKETAEKNKQNRGKVKLQQRTGSRSYIAHCYALKEKYKDEEPNAFDLFKECHNSKKKGFSEPVKQAIADMEAMRDQPIQDGQEPKSSTTIVSEVLSQISGSSKFLQNVGFRIGKKNASTTGTAAHEQQLEEALEFEREKTTTLQETIHSQQQELDALKKTVEEADAASKIQAQKMEEVKKRQEETDAILRRLLSLSQVQLTP